jgi:hypothetical protein
VGEIHFFSSIILAIEKKPNFSNRNFKYKNFVRNKMNNLSIRLFTVAALLCGVFFLANCSSTPATNSNTATVTNKPADAPKTTDAPKTAEAPKTETADSVGVPECDDYIKKYEACLTKIAKDAPQVQPSLKTSFDAQRNAIKQAVSTAEGKKMMATQCKQYVDSAKQATTAYACTW